jgi:hypothetical protein
MVHKLNIDYDSTTYVEDLKNLDILLAEAQMSPELKNAVLELKDALKRKDYNMAYELSAVKSYVTGKIDPNDKRNKFQEGDDYNTKKFGRSMYSYLDNLHHKIAFKLMKKDPSIVPAGAMVFSAGGIRQKGLPPKSTSPTLKRIEYEHNQIVKEVETGTGLHKRV